MSIDAENAEPPSIPQTATELLQAWWQVGETEQADQLLTRLLTEYAIPTIKAVINYRLRTEVAHPGDTEDVCQEVTLQLIARLKYLKSSGAPPLYGDFGSYTAAVAHQACSLFRRRKFPAWARLKDQLRYVLTHQRGFALWQTSRKVWLSGLEVWREQARSAVAARLVLDLQENAGKLDWQAVGPKGDSLIELLAAIFRHLRGPVEFAALVRLAAVVLGIKDSAPVATESGGRSNQNLPSGELVGRIEQRLYLQRLWEEIVELPLLQRRALLLNLHDAQERGLVVLLVELQITSLHQLAEVLGLAPPEFAELWRELPLDDARIACLLGLTRQQVINLRSSARRQLASRMRTRRTEK